MTDQADGFSVPEDIQHLWENTGAIQKMLSDLAYINVSLSAAQKVKDIQYQEVNFPDALACVKQLQAQLRRAIPFAVCPACQGKLRDKCALCKGRGAISKFLWDSPAVTEGIKQLRRKVKK